MNAIIEHIEERILDNLVGSNCYVRDYNGDMTCCIITRVDIFISKTGTGVNVHLKKKSKGTVNYPQCVCLEDYCHDVSYSPKGFLTVSGYDKFYK